jgi:hypothetical protein
MRFLSFKALFVLVMLPPILYVASLQGLEGYLEHHYRSALANRIPGDTQALLSGRIRLVDQLQTIVEALRTEAVFSPSWRGADGDHPDADRASALSPRLQR